MDQQIWIDSPVGTTLIGVASGAAIGLVKWLYGSISNKIKLSDERKNILQYLLGTGSHTQVIPGIDHYKYSGQANPLDQEGAKGLFNLFYSTSPFIVGPGAKINNEGNLFCVGDHVSNSFSRQHLEYVKAKGDQLFSRSATPKIKLYYETMTPRNAPSTVIPFPAPFGNLEEPNFFIVDQEGNEYIPRLDGSLLTSDYLLITKVPNFVGEAKNLGAKVVVFGGIHAVGSGAIRPALEHLDFSDLKKWQNETQGSPCFQTLIEITEIKPHNEFGQVPKRIKYIKTVPIVIQ